MGTPTEEATSTRVVEREVAVSEAREDTMECREDSIADMTGRGLGWRWKLGDKGGEQPLKAVVLVKRLYFSKFNQIKTKFS